MNKKILISSLLSIFCFALLIATSVMEASGQGRYANKYSKRDVSGIITKLEQSSNTFRRDFDRNLDQSSLNGTREEDRLNDIVRNYESSLNGLRNDFNSSDSWWQSRSNVASVMDDARQVNSMMISLPFARNLERQWNRMRQDLNKLADTFDLPDLAGGGFTGGGYPTGGYAPNWAVGTFYGRNPRTGGPITLTVDTNGTVTADFGGSSTRGTMNGPNLNMNGAYARVTQINNGIRTRSTENGETIDYYRSGGIGGGNIGGNVPDWATGTFSGRDPRSGERIMLTIRPNGEVLVNLRDSTVYGTIYNTMLTVNGATSVVKRRGRGIRTESTNNNERIDYNRESDSYDAGDGGWTGSGVPSWAVGTFYGRNPQTGGTITLIVGSSGNVSADFGGTVSNGSINGQILSMGGATARVTRISNGIRTTSTSDGQVIEYFRNGGTGDTVGGGNVSDWAVGTFYGRNPNNGRTIVLTINRNGNVTVDFGSGSLTSGSIDNNYLRVGNATSRVTKIRDGIRTTGTADGQIIDYFTNSPR